jgi:hypothetical protein
MIGSRFHRRSAWSDVVQSAFPAWKRKTGFRLPPDVTYEKQRLSDAWAYVFRHRVLGELGRILLQELDDGRCHISCEVVGDPSDPMTTQRTAIFKPLGLELTRQMEATFCATSEEAGLVDPPPRVPEVKEVIESKIIPCERCGTVVAMLIAPNATDPGRFEDCARKMYPQYNRLNVPTWIIGPALLVGLAGVKQPQRWSSAQGSAADTWAQNARLRSCRALRACRYNSWGVIGDHGADLVSQLAQAAQVAGRVRVGFGLGPVQNRFQQRPIHDRGR